MYNKKVYILSHVQSSRLNYYSSSEYLINWSFDQYLIKMMDLFVCKMHWNGAEGFCHTSLFLTTFFDDSPNIFRNAIIILIFFINVTRKMQKKNMLKTPFAWGWVFKKWEHQRKEKKKSLGMCLRFFPQEPMKFLRKMRSMNPVLVCVMWLKNKSLSQVKNSFWLIAQLLVTSWLF